MVELATTIWADGPSSTPYEPQKSQIRSWGTWIEQIITAFTSNGGLIYATRALLNADLARGANSMAWVNRDPVIGNNGVYQKSGPSGSGLWTRVSDLPFSYIIATDAGLGTANAIQARTEIPISSSAQVQLSVFRTNDGSPVTVSFNGDPALTMKTNAGNDIAPGGLPAGVTVLGTVKDGTFRLVSDQASAAVLAQAEGFANIAQAAAGNNLVFPTRAAAVLTAIPSTSHSIVLKGNLSESDGAGAQYGDVNNGSADTFVTADGRTWYRVPDVNFDRLTPTVRTFIDSRRDTRNFCWAGSFDLFRRTTSITGTAARIGANDGWSIGRSSGATGCRVSKQQGSRGSNACARVERLSGNAGLETVAYVFCLDRDETSALAGKTAVVSFRARRGANFSQAASELTCQVKTSTSLVEQAIVATNGTFTTGDTTTASFAAALTTSWQNFSIPVTLPSNIGQMAFRLAWTPVGTAGAADYFEIEEVQIETGSAATSFISPDQTLALAKAQRQYRKSYPAVVVPGTAGEYGGALRTTAFGTTAVKAAQIPVQFDDMRASPTVTIYSPQSGASGKLAQGGTDFDAAVGGISENGFGIYNNAAVVSGEVCYAHYVAEARL